MTSAVIWLICEVCSPGRKLSSRLAGMQFVQCCDVGKCGDENGLSVGHASAMENCRCWSL